MRLRAAARAVVLLLLAFPITARAADEPTGPCRPPRCTTGVIHAGTDAVPFNVLLPRSYSTSNRRYPVVYLLHGAQTNQDQWLQMGVQNFLDNVPEFQQAIVVMPYGGALDYFRDWVNKAHLYETADVTNLIPYIDTHFRTIADRAHRAVAGDSMGGYGAVMFAADHPDYYSAVGSFSGASLDHTDPDVEIGYGDAFDVYFAYCYAVGGSDPARQCGGDVRTNQDVGGFGPWGNPHTDEVWWYDSDPVTLATNFHGVDVSVFSGNGVPCDPSESGVSAAMEVREHKGALAFDNALAQAGVSHTTYLRPCGVHAASYFMADLRQWWPQMISTLGRPAPTRFSFRTAKREFSLYGWQVTADRDRAPEFLQVLDATSNGVSLTGSGLTTVSTAAGFQPYSRVRLAGATTSSVSADGDGRITFTVDLGPPHTHQQFSPQQQAEEAVVDQAGPDAYFVSRTVSFTP